MMLQGRAEEGKVVSEPRSMMCLHGAVGCKEVICEMTDWRVMRRTVVHATLLRRAGCCVQGGQAQRVVLALALSLQPEVLLLDEVTSALDHEAALKVEALLKGCGAAIIWITHNDDQPARCSLALALPVHLLWTPGAAVTDLSTGGSMRGPPVWQLWQGLGDVAELEGAS